MVKIPDLFADTLKGETCQYSIYPSAVEAEMNGEITIPKREDLIETMDTVLGDALVWDAGPEGYENMQKGFCFRDIPSFVYTRVIDKTPSTEDMETLIGCDILQMIKVVFGENDTITQMFIDDMGNMPGWNNKHTEKQSAFNPYATALYHRSVKHFGGNAADTAIVGTAILFSKPVWA